MATIILCDRCGAKIETTIIGRVVFKPDYNSSKEYDLCYECYDELEECMKNKRGGTNA